MKTDTTPYLGGFSFPSAGWTSRGGSQLVVQGSSEGDVAAISHRSDHQAPLSAHILVPIDKPDTADTV